MPLPITAAAVPFFTGRGGFEPWALVDIQVSDGTIYYVATRAIHIAAALDSGNVHDYVPWLVRCGPFRTSRDSSTDAGDVVLQNLSGNLIDRDVGKAVVARAWLGALAVVRFLEPNTQIVLREYHGYLSAPAPAERDVTFRQRQIFDSQDEIPVMTTSEQCTLTYKGAMCGSASGLATCGFTMTDCIARGAQERFNGCPSAMNKLVYPVYPVS